MAKFVLDDEDAESPEVSKTMHIKVYKDPRIKPLVTMDGNWTMREILSLQGLTIKAFRAHLSHIKADNLTQGE